MPASQRSLRLTDAYRDRLEQIHARLERDVRGLWPGIEDFDAARGAFPSLAAQAVARAQREAVRLTAGYLTAYLSSELGRRVRTVSVDAAPYLVSRDGRDLADALQSPLIGTLAALRTTPPAQALKLGLNRALRMAGTDFDAAHRAALADLMESDDRVEGWQRAVRGTCGACLGDIAVEVSVRLPSIPLQVHPYCKCVTQPVVVDVPDRFPVASGVERFLEMGREEQDKTFGVEKARRLREEPAALAALVDESHLDSDQTDFITEAPASALSSS